MAAKAQTPDTVNAIVRRQIEYLKPGTPLVAAMQEWHAEADEETRREIEAQVQAIVDTIGRLCPTPFGPGQALELLAALIAFDEGWLETDACKARRLRRKYERHARKLQYGD